MASRPLPPGAPLPDMRGKRALILDDSQTMRQALRLNVQNIGVTSIDLSDTVHDALFKLVKQGREYDFILCDYLLGDDKDGQQFLEELRHRKILPYRTVFIMVTAERGYERVVNAVELAPDDYLLKPFSSEVLLQRLFYQIQKKAYLVKLSRAMDAQAYDQALQEADALLENQVPYPFEIRRLKAEALLELHQLEAAHSLYTALLSERNLPWAKFGLARIAHMRNNLPQAEEVLENLLAEAPAYTAAYDLLSDVKHELNNHAGAQLTLAKGVSVSPRNLKRNRRLGAAALLNGDLDTANKALAAVIEHGKHSALLDPVDFINQSRCSLARGDFEAAARQAEAGQSRFPGDKVMTAAAYFVHSQGAEIAADPAKAQALVRDGLALVAEAREEGEVPAEVVIAGVDACLGAKLEQLATDIANQLLADQQRRMGDMRAATLTAINQSFKAAGANDVSEALLQKTREEMAQINNRAVSLVESGQTREAMTLFKQAAAGKSASPVAIQNAIRATLMVLEKESWDDELARDVVYLLNRARDKEPNSSKIQALQTQWEAVQKKHGKTPVVAAASIDDVLAMASL